MNVGRAIKILRETNDIRLASLANEAGISASMLSMIESGQREPSLGVLRRISLALGVPLDTLIAVAQPGEGTLSSSDARAKDFASVLKKLEKIENELRALSQGASQGG
jgi:transcriptional regulator with XRE-family HTH domain